MEREGTLEQFIRLNQELPKVICDQKAIGKAPQLQIVQEQKRGKRPDQFWLALDSDESDWFEFLFENPSSLLWSKRLRLEIEKNPEPQSLLRFKTEVSQELCQSLITPSHFEAYYSKNKDLFFRLKLKKPTTIDPLKGWARVQDPDERSAKISGAWTMGGWIEPHEVDQIITKNRVYRRIAHPLTNTVQWIQVETSSEIPLGYLYLAQSPFKLSLSESIEQLPEEKRNQKKLDLYQTVIENQAYLKLKSSPDRVEEIKKIQSFYMNLIKAYGLYPDDPKFKKYQPYQHSGKDLFYAALDESFLKALRQARVNQAYVQFQGILPDLKLHAIYKEYQERMEGLK